MTDEIKESLAKCVAQGNLLKAEASTERPPLDKGKGKERPGLSESEHESGEESLLLRSPAGEEYKKIRSALQNRLRECRLTLHRVKFFQGDVYHCLGGDYSASEDAAYDAAEEIRRELLKGLFRQPSRFAGDLICFATGRFGRGCHSCDGSIGTRCHATGVNTESSDD